MSYPASDFGELLNAAMDGEARNSRDVEKLSRKFGFWFRARGVVENARRVPWRTIENWRNGMRPHAWQKLVIVALCLNRTAAETDELFAAANFSTLAQLRARATRPEDKKLLAYFTSPSEASSPAPFQAIAQFQKFVGRSRYLAQLERELRKGPSVALWSVRGMGGVGKIMLAAELAYRLRDHFQDGILWAQLDISDPLAILASFADAYGVDVSAHRDIVTRGAAVRNLLKDKQALIVLDNAVTNQQVRDLLPPMPGKAAVLITSRSELVVTDDMRRVRLEPFKPRSGESFLLLQAKIGRGAWRQKSAWNEIARLLGHLPLALSIAAGHILRLKQKHTLAFAVQDFLARARDEKKRLGALDLDDLSVRVSLGVSYEALAEELQTFFVTLGAFGGQDFDSDAAAYVTQVSQERAAADLRALEQLSLAQEMQAGRFSLHELVRDFAREKLVGTDAYARMCEYYFQCVEPHVKKHAFGSVVAEDSNIQAALQTALTLQDSALLAHGTLVCADYLISQGHFAFYDEILEVTQNGLNADAKFEHTRLWLKRGELARLWGKYGKARACFEQGLPLAYELEEPETIVQYLNNLGIMRYYDGDYQDAEKYYRQALAIALENNFAPILSGIYGNLVQVKQVQGDFDAAENFLEQASHSGAMSWQAASVTILVHRGRIAVSRGEFDQAERLFLSVLGKGEQIGLGIRRIGAYDGLGQLALARGEWSSAVKYFQKLLQVGNELQHQGAIALAYRGLGETEWRQGDISQGEKNLRRALELIQQTDERPRFADVLTACLRFYLAQQRWNDARATIQWLLEFKNDYAERRAELFFGAAQIHHVEGNVSEARECTQDALALYEKMGHYRVPKVRAWLEDLENGIFRDA